MSCDLCEAAVITRRYFQNEECWIADCEICMVPMVVWREHSASPSDEVRERLLGWLSEVAEREFADAAWYVDDTMRNIPEHYHAHARRRGAFFGRF